MVKKWNLVGAVVIIAILAFSGLSIFFGSVNPQDWNNANPGNGGNGNGNGGNGNGNTNQVLNYGSFDVNTKGYNTLDFSAALSENSTYNVMWVAMRGGAPQRLGSNTQSIQLIAQDYGIVWAVVEPAVADYVDAANTVSKNSPYVIASQYGDIDNDGYDEWAFKVDMSQTPAPQGIGNNRELWFYPYFLPYQTISLSNPADITGIGTASVQSFVDWEATFSTVNHAFAITKIELIANTTSLTDITINKMNLPGVGQITSAMFGQPYRGVDSLTWTYTISNGLNGANYVSWSSNSQNKVDLSLQLGTRLSTSEIIDLTLNVYGLDETGTPVSVVTNTIALEEA